MLSNCGISFLEVSSVALGGKIVSFSDEFFADASNLLKVHVSSPNDLAPRSRNCIDMLLGSSWFSFDDSPRSPWKANSDLKELCTMAGRPDDTMPLITTGKPLIPLLARVLINTNLVCPTSGWLSA
jgi:hypothetical protein